MSLNTTSLSLSKGQSARLYATVSPSDATDQSITWSSANSSIASVNSEGDVTAVSPGTTTITASCGDHYATCQVTVTDNSPIPVTGVSLNTTSLSLSKGQRAKLYATVSPSDATDQNITWFSANSLIASVNSEGDVTAVSQGTTTITARCGNHYATCQVNVTDNSPIPVTGVSLNANSLSLLTGQIAMLYATVSPSDATDQSITWSSENSSIASVSSDGDVTAVSPGTTTIKASCGDHYATCQVTVIDNYSPTTNKFSVENSDGTTIYYSKTSPTTVAVSYQGEFSNPSYTGNVVIPSSVTYGGTTYFVTSIDDYAFMNCVKLTEVTIPNSVTLIGNSAFFNCTDLTSMTIGNSVTSIGEEAFNFCSSLSGELIIPDSVTSIGNGAFSDCSGLTSVKIGDSVTSIGDSAFYYCSGLTSVTLGNSVTSIGINAFSCCTGLSGELTIPDSVISIGNNAFYLCSGLTTVTLGNSVTSIGKEAFSNCGSLSSVNISSIETLLNATIGDNIWGESNKISLFINNQEAKELTIPGSFKTVKPNCFYPFLIEKIVLEDGVEIVEAKAFNDYGTCVLELGKDVKQIATLFHDVTLVKCHAQTPPTINEDAFYSCTFNNENPGVVILDTPNMEEAYLNAPVWKDLMTSHLQNTVEVTVEEPGKLALKIINAGIAPAKVVGLKVNGTLNVTDFEKMRVNMMALTKLDLTDLDITTMPENVLNSKFQLESLKLPKNCTEIQESSLAGCSGLTNLDIPNKVTIIGKNALSGCYNLSSIVLPTSLTEICEGAFRDCRGLKAVTFNNSLTTIGNQAFYNTSLQNLHLNQGLKTIGDEAFAGCQINQELELPESLVTIGSDAFRGQNIYGHLSVPESVSTIGSGAFAGTEISTLFLNSSLTELASGVFENCRNLNTIYVPDNITVINDRAFLGCSSLSNLRFSATLTEIGEAAFQSSALHSAILPNGITAIEKETFDQCDKLRSASIPSGVTRIGDGAYRGCTSLRNLTVKVITPPAINSSTFLGVNTNLCIISIPTVSFEAYALSNYWGRFVQMRNDIAVNIEGDGTLAYDSADEEEDSEGEDTPARIARLKAQADTETEDGSTIFVPKGGKVRFFITPADGCEIISVTLNGEDITDQIENGMFVTTADTKGNNLIVNFSSKASTYEMGDVNESGEINITDVVMIVSHVVGITQPNYNASLADVDNSGSVTITDAVWVVRYVVGAITSFPNQVIKRSRAQADLAYVAVTAEQPESDYYDVTLSLNSTRDVAGLQLTVNIPDGFALVDNSLAITGNMQDFYTMVNDENPSIIKIAALSTSSTPLTAGDEQIITMTLKRVNPEVSYGKVIISDIEIADNQGSSYVLDDAYCTLSAEISGLESMNGSESIIRVEGMKILLTLPTAQRVMLTNLSGQTSYYELPEGNSEIDVTTPGIYIISTCDKLTKIILK